MASTTLHRASLRTASGWFLFVLLNRPQAQELEQADRRHAWQGRSYTFCPWVEANRGNSLTFLAEPADQCGRRTANGLHFPADSIQKTWPNSKREKPRQKSPTTKRVTTKSRNQGLQ